MTDKGANDLYYGYTGFPIYDTATSSWRFPRQDVSRRRFFVLNPLQCVINSSRSSQSSNVIGAPCNAAQTDSPKALLYDFPEILPASGTWGDGEPDNKIVTDDLLRSLQISPAVDDIIAESDGSPSNILAHGRASIRNYRQYGRNLDTTCIAMVAGPTDELLRLIVPKQQYITYRDASFEGLSITTDSKTIFEGEEGWWMGTGSPIQQLTFARSSDGQSSDILAVRQRSIIFILRLSLQATQKGQGHGRRSRQQQSLPVSRLKAHVIATLSIDDARSVPFVDVSFCSCSLLQVVTIDEGLSWIIWQILPPSAKSIDDGKWTVIKIRHEVMSPASQSAYNPPTTETTWAKALFVFDHTVLLLVRRKSLQIFVFSGEETHVCVPHTLGDDPEEQVLGVKPALTNAGHIFLVTTSRVLWVQIFAPESVQHSDDISACRFLLSWQHYRKPGDTTLSLELIEEDEEIGNNSRGKTTIFTLLLTSSTFDLNVIYTFEFVHTDQRATSLVDPYLLSGLLPPAPIPFIQAKARQRANVFHQVTMHFEPYDMKSRNRSKSKTLGSDNFDFWRLRCLHRDLSVSEAICVRCSEAGFSSVKAINPQIASAKLKNKSSYLVMDDGFIVSGSESEFESESSNSEFDMNDRQRRSKIEDQRFLNFTWLIDNLRGMDNLQKAHSTKNSIQNIRPWHDYLQDMDKSLQIHSFERDPSLLLLSECSTVSYALPDIDEAVRSLEQMLQDRPYTDLAVQAQSQDGNQSSRLADVRSVTIPFSSLRMDTTPDDHAKLRETYDRLLGLYLTNLPSKVSIAARVSLDKILRRTAAESCLASLGVHPPLPILGSQDTGPDINHKGPPSSQNVGTSLTQGSGKSKGKEKELQLQMVNSEAADPDSSALMVDAASQRLQQLIHLKPQVPLPPQSARILDQWTIGTDPELYDWALAQRIHTAAIATTNGLESQQKSRTKRERRQLPRPVTAPDVLPSSQPFLGSQASQALQDAYVSAAPAIQMSQDSPRGKQQQNARTPFVKKVRREKKAGFG